MMDLSYIDETRQMLEKLLPAEKIKTVNEDYIKGLLKRRDPKAHKGIFGHALLYAGSPGMAGAAVLSTKACMRSGVGLLTVCTPAANNDILQISVPEAMVTHTDDMYASSDLGRYTAIGAGPGLGTGESQIALLDKMLKNATCPMVLDADALNIISQKCYLLDYVPSGSVITPHPGEMSRLCGKTVEEIQKDRINTARNFANEYGCIVVLKGMGTVIHNGKNGSVNRTGTGALATAGTGDVLSGIIGAFVCQQIECLKASIAGVCLHGLCADFLSDTYSLAGTTASDLIAVLKILT